MISLMIEHNTGKKRAVVGSVLAAVAAVSLVAADYTYSIRDRMQPMTEQEAEIAEDLNQLGDRYSSKRDVRVECGFDILEETAMKVLGSDGRAYVVQLPNFSSNVINLDAKVCAEYSSGSPKAFWHPLAGFGATAYSIPVNDVACLAKFVNQVSGDFFEQKGFEEGQVDYKVYSETLRDDSGCDKTFEELIDTKE